MYQCYQNKEQNQKIVRSYSAKYKDSFSLHLNDIEIANLVVQQTVIEREDINVIVDDIQSSILYYQFVNSILDEPGYTKWLYISLIGDYVSALEAHSRNSNDGVVLTVELEHVLLDLIVIGDWLKNTTNAVHYDHEFYDEVYEDLRSTVKDTSDYSISNK